MILPIYWYQLYAHERRNILQSTNPLLLISVHYSFFRAALIDFRSSDYFQQFSNSETQLSIYHKERAAIAHALRLFHDFITNDTLIIILL